MGLGLLGRMWLGDVLTEGLLGGMEVGEVAH